MNTSKTNQKFKKKPSKNRFKTTIVKKTKSSCNKTICTIRNFTMSFQNAKKKRKFSADFKPTKISRHEKLKYSKIYENIQKTGPDWIRTSERCLYR